STIVDFSHGTPVLLRPGHISKEAIQAVLGGAIGDANVSSPRHSGGLARHYAPRTPARLVPAYDLDKEIARRKARVAVLAFSRPDERADYWLRMPRDPIGYARKLYGALREVDAAGCD